ncbi:flagellar hook-associated protein FlgL [Methylotenera versatilis]|uniref:Flagellar hook-associated protein 3 n=1 Tax=Methylotenera versatilis (strain 301) TaxID=666681 RepID=D7DJ60_METV0|nr:flagellar hook-associated protein FlgL [Methylotenera versatilis]ADI30095.1 flagellar hook-associated protein 3 [Methylotenera versatilis 301]
MRISTNTIYQAGISRISNIQSDQAKLQEQISTGRRISSPSDDPVGAARALEISAAQSGNAKFADTRQTAQLKLNTLESNLTSITSLLVSTQSTLVGAGNATLSDTERGFMASELKGSLDALIGLANTQDASGNYLYAGYKTSTVPFVATASGANYAGDSNQQLLQVDTQRQMAINATGDNVFQAGGNDVFATLSNLVTLLNTPITNAASQAAYNAGLSTAIGSLKGSVDNVLNVRADIGAKLNEIDNLDTAGSDRALQYSKSLSDLQDTDYASALSDLAKQQTIMEAAQKSFVQITSLSLFKLL